MLVSWRFCQYLKLRLRSLSFVESFYAELWVPPSTHLCGVCPPWTLCAALYWLVLCGETHASLRWIILQCDIVLCICCWIWLLISFRIFFPCYVLFGFSIRVISCHMEWFGNIFGKFLKVWCSSVVWQNSFMMSPDPRIFLHESFSLRILLLIVGVVRCYNFFRGYGILCFCHFDFLICVVEHGTPRVDLF